MKAAIFTTYYGSRNYGGLLQAYALQQAMIGLGMECTDVCYEAEYSPSNAIHYSFTDKLLMNYKNQGHPLAVTMNLIGRVIFKKIYGKKIRLETEKRDKKFQEFRERFIIHTDTVYHEGNLDELTDKADVFITGSDLVWNLGDSEKLLKGYWLTFATGKRKIAYAASIPMASLSARQAELVKDALKDFTAISVRETVGKQLLDTLIKPPCKVMHAADPVFLLDKKAWACFANVPAKVPSDYILTYFLGESKEHRKFARMVAKQENKEIINLAHVARFCKEDIHFGISAIDISPQEFVGLVRNASMILTDSFHGSAFSVIFEKEFYVLERFSQNSGNTLNERIYSLLASAGIKDCLLQGTACNMFRLYSKKHANFTGKKNPLSNMIQSSFDFLKHALE